MNSCWYHTNNNHFEFNKRRDLNKERRGEGLSLSVSVVTGAKWECGLTWRITHYSIRLLLKRKLGSNGLWPKRPMIWTTAGWGDSCGWRRFRRFAKQGLSVYDDKTSPRLTARLEKWDWNLQFGGEDTFMIWILHLPVSSCQSWTVERLIAAKGSTA